ncbi:MAG: Peptidoglycan-binding LysM [Bacteroidetes bacterium]|nr:Peptidoglycan-binding LysM [Bacteroidota bacterium]
MADLEALKSKYASVLKKGEQVGLRLENVHIQDEKLFIRGGVPSEFAKNQIWDEIKRINTSLSDITADINVKPGGSYTVQSGDSLSKIAKRFYGDAKLYPKIFEANRDQLSDPDKIRVGQSLKLP